MANWKEVLAEIVVDVEHEFDMLKYRLRERLGGRDPVMILPYRGFGTQKGLYLVGRVLEDKGIEPPTENDSIWDNLANMYKRFESDEIPYAKVRARYQDIEQEVTADVEGMFEVYIKPEQPLDREKLWQEIELELVDPIREGAQPARAIGQVLAPPPSARFGVISDIDDTVLQTGATNVLKMARTVFLGNAKTRLPFKGVAAFYRALFEGAAGSEHNPLFYVSSSPWNLYDLLTDFFHLQDIPIGPALFLRNWGISEEEFLPTEHRTYKLGACQRILNVFEDLPFILVGDSGQEDPEIYHELVSLYPDRIMAIYIRNVTRNPERAEAISKLAEEVVEAGSDLLLAEDTLLMARHAIGKGWIRAEAFPSIEIEKEKDEAPPSPVEKLLGET